jgi:hypothetical protein
MRETTNSKNPFKIMKELCISKKEEQEPTGK